MIVSLWNQQYNLPIRVFFQSVEVDGTSVVLNDLIPGTDYTVTIKSKIVNRQSDDSLEGSFINFVS